jgi:cbb3-type cytochrome oxidase subunit 1
MAHAPETSVHASQLGPVRLPIHFFAVATAFFLLGVSAMPWITPDVIEFFYQPLPLALVHAFTLGWITATIMGVMYRYVPALTRTPLRFPRLAYAQLILFVIGAAGMVAHFAIGVWLGTWLAAIVMVVSVIMFAANMLPCLAPKAGGGVAETGMLIAVGFLVLAASVGLLLALDKTFGFLHGSVLTNLAGHAHLAALGWVTLTICAVSYRMIPAFVLPQVGLPRSAVWQLYGLAFGVAGLVATLFAEIPVVIKFEIHPSGPAPLKGHAGQSHHFWVHS